MRKVCRIDGVDCANCADKVERKINKVKGVEEATFNFMTSRLTVEFKSDDEEEVKELMEEIRKVVDKAEPGAVVVE